jgi:hypothetical protein
MLCLPRYRKYVLREFAIFCPSCLFSSLRILVVRICFSVTRIGRLCTAMLKKHCMWAQRSFCVSHSVGIRALQTELRNQVRALREEREMFSRYFDNTVQAVFDARSLAADRYAVLSCLVQCGAHDVIEQGRDHHSQPLQHQLRPPRPAVCRRAGEKLQRRLQRPCRALPRTTAGRMG